MDNQRKSPYLAALLNLLFFGAGYLYLGKRLVLGSLLFLASIIMFIEYFSGTIDLLGHIVSWENIADTHSISMTIIAIALAYDAYKLAIKND